MNQRKRIWAGSMVLMVAALATLLPVVTSDALARQGRGRGRGGDNGGGSGGGGSRARVRREFRLIPTPEGAADDLKGKARIEARGDRNREKINVEIESDELPEGTEFEVYAVNPSQSPDPIFLGVLTLGVGDDDDRDDDEAEGELELKNWDGGTLPSGASPVASITEFFVTEPDSDVVVLRSSTRR